MLGTDDEIGLERPGRVAQIVAVDLAFGFIHGITLAFGITLLGVVDDYPIHLFSHLTRETRAPAVMKEIWPTMRLGVVATALGFSALLLSGFPGLSQLGLFAIVGLFTAAGVTRWVLPHLVPAGFQARREGLQVARWADTLAKARLVVPLVVGLAIASFVWSDTPLWEQDIANLSPISTEKMVRDQALRNELGVPDVRDLIVVEGSSEEEVLKRSETVALALDPLVAKGALHNSSEERGLRTEKKFSVCSLIPQSSSLSPYLVTRTGFEPVLPP